MFQRDIFKAYFHKQASFWGTPAAACLVYDGMKTYSFTFGKGVTSKSCFQIGSITKQFTVALLQLFMEKHKNISWDMPISDIIESVRPLDQVLGRPLLLAEAASHRSGIKRHDLSWLAQDGVYTKEKLLHHIQNLPPSDPIGARWNYQNHLYALLGLVVEELYDLPYGDTLDRFLLTPLGMKESPKSRPVVSKEAFETHLRKMQGFRQETPEDTPKKVESFDFGAMEPAGALCASVADMAPWLKALLAESPTLSKDLRCLFETPVIATQRPDKGGLLGEKETYGLGMFQADYRGHKVMHHGGQTIGFGAFLAYCPSLKAAIITLTNLETSALGITLADKLLGMMMGTSPMQDPTSRRKSLFQVPPPLPSLAGESLKPEDFLRRYQGTYRHPLYGILTFSDQGVSFENLRVDLKEATDRQFRLKIPFIGTVDGTVCLSESPQAEGIATHLRLPLEESMECVFQKAAA